MQLLIIMRICAVSGCSNSDYTLKKQRLSGITSTFELYKFPSIKTHPQLRETWIKCVNRFDVVTNKRWEPTRFDRICSRHFEGGKLSEDNDRPTLHLGYTPVTPSRKRPAPRKRQLFETDTGKVSNIVKLTVAEKRRRINLDHNNYYVTCRCVENCECTGCVEKEKELKKLRHEVAYLKCKNENSESSNVSFTDISKLIDTDSKVSKATGLQSIKQFDALFAMLKANAKKMKYWRGKCYAKKRPTKQFKGPHQTLGPERKLTKKQEFLLVLMKLRQGLSNFALGIMFDVSETTVSRIFNTWIKFLASQLKSLIVWPSRTQIDEVMPESMRSCTNLRCTIDCTEVKIERPRDRKVQALTWSDYKKHNTVKVLVAIAPNGAISYLSKAWGGKASDRHITVSDGFLDKIEPGDLILADRGFTIHDMITKKYARLDIPPGGSGLEQMSRENVHKTKHVANKRIHVERAIGRIKVYEIFNKVLPVNMVPLIDDIFTVCAALCNLLPPLT